MSNVLLDARNVTRRFDELVAVSRLDLQVCAGEIFGLIGPDGAGKTTLMRMLCGALLPDEGEITINELDLAKYPDQARENLGYLSQKFSLYEELTVLENLRFFAEVRALSGNEWKPRALETLDFVGLGEFIDRRAGKLSGGMKQKLGLATALVHRPSLLLLDEPTGGVDPVTRQDFWQLIIRLISNGEVGVLVSTPYMDEVVRCTRIGMIVGGRMVLEGPPDELHSLLEGRVLEMHGQPLLAWRRAAIEIPDVQDVQVFGDRLHLRIELGQEKRVIRTLKRIGRENDLDFGDAELIKPQLEDVFIAKLAEYSSKDGLHASSSNNQEPVEARHA
jgi:ABC-2 type transport system ATP-binding protein